MKILVFGSKGFIGSRMLEMWPDAIGSEVRVEDKAAVLAEIDKHKPDAVVNATGRTGRPNVDWCESHPVETMHSNVIGALLLAEACQEKNVYLLHISSGCMFYGHSPDPRGWTENDFANPSATYSRGKYATELVLTTLPNVGIARLRMPIDDRPSDRNLIDKLAKYKHVIDVANSVTVVSDLIDVCRRLIEKRGQGIFHAVNPGVMRHRELLELYKEYVDPQHQTEWIREEELVSRGLATKKRSNNIMQSTRLRELGIEMRPIDVALRDTMIKYAERVRATRNAQLKPNHPSYDMRYEMRDTRAPKMKGIITAGGKGTRLQPLTHITNKHLLPVANKQMVLYPLQTLLDAGIRDIMIITGPDHAGDFMNLLGSGAKFGCRLTYRIQDESGGIAQAIGMAEEFVGTDNCTVILGDNLFEDNFMAPISSFQSGGLIFYKAVPDARRFGVLELDAIGRVISIEEKPQNPKSNFASAGLYVYDHRVFDIIKTLKPSARGELEITDIHKGYLAMNELIARPVRGFWSDAGTFESLKRASDFFDARQK